MLEHCFPLEISLGSLHEHVNRVAIARRGIDKRRKSAQCTRNKFMNLLGSAIFLSISFLHVDASE